MNTVEKKLEYIRADHAARLDALAEKRLNRYGCRCYGFSESLNGEISLRAAALVERHLGEVEQAIAIVRSAIASKLDWFDTLF